MIIFVLILGVIIIASSKFRGRNEFNAEYISKDSTLPVKGIFVILILISHTKLFFPNALSGSLDEAYVRFQGHIVQMVVAMFLFYSGYGIMEQIKKREFSYIKSMMTKRFPNLLLNYDIAVLFYIVLTICLRREVSFTKIIFALTAWDGIGNSSWFIFVTLCLYLLTALVFSTTKRFTNKRYYIINIIVLTALSVGLALLLKSAGKESWWYNTIVLFAVGFWYSYFKEPIEKFVMKNDLTYIITICIISICYILSYLHRGDSLFAYYLFGIAFIAAVVAVTMKLEIKSNILNWFGEHVFSIYILQKIPMMIMQKIGFAQAHRYLFVILSIVITCLMAEAYDIMFAKLSAKIWKPKKN